tara:strand:+ start:5470 stop:5676 length:207 start_codon:yes stop_codon:yes gene_type:complete
MFDQPSVLFEAEARRRGFKIRQKGENTYTKTHDIDSPRFRFKGSTRDGISVEIYHPKSHTMEYIEIRR